MRWILLVAAALTALVLEVTLFDRLVLWGARPHLVLALALLIAATSRRFDLVCTATWVSGLLVDMVSGARFGTFSLLYLVAAMTAFGLKRFVSGDSIPGQIFLVTLLVMAVEGIHGLVATRSIVGVPYELVAWRAGTTAFYTALLVLPVRWMARPVLVKFGREAEWLH